MSPGLGVTRRAQAAARGVHLDTDRGVCSLSIHPQKPEVPRRSVATPVCSP